MRINALVAKAQKTPEEGWTMEDGTPWPGNKTRDHPGMIQVSLAYNIFQFKLPVNSAIFSYYISCLLGSI